MLTIFLIDIGMGNSYVTPNSSNSNNVFNLNNNGNLNNLGANNGNSARKSPKCLMFNWLRLVESKH